VTREFSIITHHDITHYVVTSLRCHASCPFPRSEERSYRATVSPCRFQRPYSYRRKTVDDFPHSNFDLSFDPRSHDNNFDSDFRGVVSVIMKSIKETAAHIAPFLGFGFWVFPSEPKVLESKVFARNQTWGNVEELTTAVYICKLMQTDKGANGIKQKAQCYVGYAHSSLLWFWVLSLPFLGVEI